LQIILRCKVVAQKDTFDGEKTRVQTLETSL
jgi:hypothetical protein